VFESDTDRSCCEESYRRGFHDAARFAVDAAGKDADAGELTRWVRQVQAWLEQRQGGELEYPPFPPTHDGWDARRPVAKG
jgi:hypothetical protein